MEDQIQIISANDLKKNDYLIINGRPCQITDLTYAKTGKHGGRKCHIKAVDIFRGRNQETACNSGDNLDAPIVRKTSYDLINLTSERQEDGSTLWFCSLSADGKVREDLKLPVDNKELSDVIVSRFEAGENLILNVLSALKEEEIVSYTVSK